MRLNRDIAVAPILPPSRPWRRWSLVRVALVLAFGTVLSLPMAAQMSGTVVGQPIGPAVPVTPQPVPNQFGPFTNPPYDLDTVRGEIVNLETQLIAPILLTRDGGALVAINEPDHRVVVLNPTTLEIKTEIPLGQGLAALAERPGDFPEGHGEIWVTMRHQSAVVVIDRATWRPTALLRPPVNQTARGTRHASNPGGIAFNKAGTKAYVAAGNTDRLVIYDAVNKTHLQNLALSRTHNGRVTAMNEPMAVISEGDRIFVASHLSGNQALVDYRSGSFPQTLGFANVFIEDLDDDLTFTRRLPDFDIFEVNAATDAVVGHWSGVGTLLFGFAIDPSNGNLVVANMEARNGELIGEGSFPGGRVARNRVTWATPNQNPASYTIVNTEDLGPSNFDLVMPAAVAVDPVGTAYVAGYASSSIGVFSPTGAFLGASRAPAGPRGLALSHSGKVLYSLNRADNSVSRYDLSGGIPLAPQLTRGLHDPTFDAVKKGRKIFLSPKSSGDGTAGCFSCHQDLRKDGAGWQISKFFDVGENFTEENPPAEWRDPKGVMVTQDLRSLPEVPGYHWRGEQKDLEDFNGAFVDLLKAPAKMPPRDFALFKAYVFSAHYPPNPFQPLNRVYSTQALAGFGGAPRTFSATCEGCHALPTGTDSSITEAFLGNPGTPFADKTAQLRGLWTKLSSLANVQTSSNVPEELWPLTGFGLVHEGQVDDMPEFMARFFSGFSATEAANTNRFITELDTGLAPFTHWSEYLDAATAGSHRINSYMIPQANAGNGDLIARGRMVINGSWQTLGLLWDVPSQTFLPSLSSLGAFGWPAIQARATAGEAELLFMGVPGWSGERLALDRDRDGVRDGDEVAQGLTPTNPDTDADGLWDSYDPQPLAANGALPVGAPQVVPGSVQAFIFGANGARVTYETDTFSPTRIEFGPTTSYGFTSGDSFPLPTGAANDSNLWKRRHVVFIRPQPGQNLPALDDGTLYHFRIHTQGQNGMTAVTADFDTGSPLLTDAASPNFRFESIALSATRTGLQVDYSAVVRAVDNDGQPAPVGSGVAARYTFYTASGFDSQAIVIGTTDANGFATLTASTTNQATGDRTIFDIPMAQVLTATPFHWPEGAIADEILAP